MWDTSELSATVRMKKLGDIDWPRHYAALIEYDKQYGHCNVHKKYKKDSYVCELPGMGENGGSFHYEGKLGAWLSNQRAFHNGKRGEKRLLPEREQLLQILVDQGKLLWDASARSGTKVQGAIAWPRHFAALLEYRKVHGHCNVPKSQNFDCLLPAEVVGENGDRNYSGKLGRWLRSQREAKKRTVSQLLPEREELLQSLVDEGALLWETSVNSLVFGAPRTFTKKQGDVYVTSSTIDWNTYYCALCEYGKIYGHCNIPAKDSFECALVGMGENGTNIAFNGKIIILTIV
jgi:hypothetical protein